MMNRNKHPFYHHSEADFFTAWKGGKMVGRIAALMNTSFNHFHNEKVASFFLFDALNDLEVSNALFDAVTDWAKERGLETLVGPKGFSLFDGYGMLAGGFNERQMMNMSSYNYPYYINLVEQYGFEKTNEFLSMSFDLRKFELPEKASKLAAIIQKRGNLKIFTFKNRREITKNAEKIARLYEKSFENNWEYFPLTDAEIHYMIDNVIKFVDPKMVKFIANEQDELVGFLLTFPDLSGAMQRHNGILTPGLIVDLLLELRRTRRVSLNGIGLLEEYRNKGGTALLYNEIFNIFHDHGRFVDGEATQMAESAKEIQREMAGLGLTPTKHHRVYKKNI